VQAESLVVIRTFHDLLHADEAQVELLSAGIHSLVFEESSAGLPGVHDARRVALAVHRRDADVATAVLPPASPA
jgi:hypothetical protein